MFEHEQNHWEDVTTVWFGMILLEISARKEKRCVLIGYNLKSLPLSLFVQQKKQQ